MTTIPFYTPLPEFQDGDILSATRLNQVLTNIRRHTVPALKHRVSHHTTRDGIVKADKLAHHRRSDGDFVAADSGVAQLRLDIYQTVLRGVGLHHIGRCQWFNQTCENFALFLLSQQLLCRRDSA